MKIPATRDTAIAAFSAAATAGSLAGVSELSVELWKDRVPDSIVLGVAAAMPSAASVAFKPRASMYASSCSGKVAVSHISCKHEGS